MTKAVLFAGDGPVTDEQVKSLVVAVDRAVRKNIIIMTADRGDVAVQVIRQTNTLKYKRVVVWGAGGACQYVTNFGHNQLARYAEDQRDDVLVSRSNVIVFVGRVKTPRMKRMTKFAYGLGRNTAFIKRSGQWEKAKSWRDGQS
jgi:hypothetical protein